jgi:tetraacyldisaccharide 4'-kinase
LRESFASAVKKAGALIMIGKDAHGLANRVKIPVWQAKLQPKPSLSFHYEGRFVAFAGIGRPEKFYATARALGLDIAATRDFPDHHLFNQDDLELLRLMAEEQGAQLLTTEKDAVRLPSDFRADVVVMPVELVFDSPTAAQDIATLFRELI